jgi:hypothetical protein
MEHLTIAHRQRNLTAVGKVSTYILFNERNLPLLSYNVTTAPTPKLCPLKLTSSPRVCNAVPDLNYWISAAVSQASYCFSLEYQRRNLNSLKSFYFFHDLLFVSSVHKAKKVSPSSFLKYRPYTAPFYSFIFLFYTILVA